MDLEKCLFTWVCILVLSMSITLLSIIIISSEGHSLNKKLMECINEKSTISYPGVRRVSD